MRLLAAAVLGLVLAGCGSMAPSRPTPPGAPPTAPQVPGGASQPGLIDTLDHPAHRALYDAIRAYDDGQLPVAERALRRALSAGLRSARDRAAAHKLLAFIQCSSERYAACEAQFRAARQADPHFALGPTELAHPLWGPVYRRTVPAR